MNDKTIITNGDSKTWDGPWLLVTVEIHCSCMRVRDARHESTGGSVCVSEDLVAENRADTCMQRTRADRRSTI